MNDVLAPLIAQWHANRRLRAFAAIALLAVVANLAAAMGEARRETITAYRADQQLLVRLEGAAADAAWTDRAREATEALAAREATMVVVAGPGQAQAELQAALSAAAVAAGIPDAAVRTEGAAEVEGLPGVREVSARLAGTASGPAATALLADLARRGWIRVDRVEIRDGAPGQVQLIARGYFREAPEGATP